MSGYSLKKFLEIDKILVIEKFNPNDIERFKVFPKNKPDTVVLIFNKKEEAEKARHTLHPGTSQV